MYGHSALLILATEKLYVHSISRMHCDKNYVSCKKECKFYQKAKEIENLRQDDKITFDEAKRHYF